MTRSIQTLVVPLDLTEHDPSIVAWALDWASLKRARLMLLHVLARAGADGIRGVVDSLSHDEHYSRLRETIRKRLLPLARRAEAEGVDVTVRIRMGFPADEILTEARECGADLIILGAHGRLGPDLGGEDRIFNSICQVNRDCGWCRTFCGELGTTAEKVIRLAECPVFLVREGRSTHPLRAPEPTRHVVPQASW